MTARCLRRYLQAAADLMKQEVVALCALWEQLDIDGDVNGLSTDEEGVAGWNLDTGNGHAVLRDGDRCRLPSGHELRRLARRCITNIVDAENVSRNASRERLSNRDAGYELSGIRKSEEGNATASIA